MGRRNIPPRILKLLQEQPYLFAAKKGRCLPPRMLKLQHEHQPSRTCRERSVPPRILKLQQQKYGAMTEPERFIPPRMLKLQQEKDGAMMEPERFLPPRMVKLQEEKLQQRSKLQEIHIEVRQENILLLWHNLVDQPRAFLGRQEPLLHLRRGWIEVGQLMQEQLQERQQPEVELEQTLAEKEYQSREEQDIANAPIIDYSRLTSSWSKILHS